MSSPLPLARLSAVLFVLFLLIRWTGGDIVSLPLVSLIANAAALLLLSWSIGVTIARHFLLPLLPRVETRDKAVLVTGCDSGFGFATALKLNADGFLVVAGVLDPEASRDKLTAAADHPDRLRVIRLDVTSEEEVVQARDFIVNLQQEQEAAGRPVVLFALVNNAGILLNRGIEFAKAPSITDFQKQMEVNFFGVVRMTRTLLPLIRASRGRIVTVASQAARTSTPSFVGYQCSKAAAAKFTEGLQSELSAFGVIAIGVDPYMHKTPLVAVEAGERSIREGWLDAEEEVRQAYGASFLERMVAFLRHISTDPFFVCERPANVADAISDALTSPEPALVIECIQWTHWLIRKLTVDLIPWDLTVPVCNHLNEKVATAALSQKTGAKA